MPVIFKCDGCDKEVEGHSDQGRWYKPHDWFQRSDEDGAQVACSRDCIEKVAKKSGKTSVVLPI